MIESLLNTTPVPLLEKVAKFAEQRQAVLAGNVANVDTPGYRMRDLPVEKFQAALKAAVARMHPTGGLRSNGDFGSQAGQDSAALTAPPPFPEPIWSSAQSTVNLFPKELFTAETPSEQRGITSLDGNNRSVESHMLEMTKNAMLQQFAVQLMQSQFSQLEAVISERA